MLGDTDNIEAIDNNKGDIERNSILQLEYFKSVQKTFTLRLIKSLFLCLIQIY